MKTTFVETYAFAFAHHLPDLPVEHECHGLHGHTSTITLTIEVEHEGRLAFDRAELDGVADRVLAPISYKVINEVPGLADGLAETQLLWLVDAFSLALLELGAVLVAAELDEMAADHNRLVHHLLLWRHPSR